jgi:hypothetical protein
MTKSTKIALLLIVAVMFFGNAESLDARGHRISNEVWIYLQKINATADSRGREELCREFAQHVRNKGTQRISAQEIEQIERLLNDDDAGVRMQTVDLLADFGPRAKSATPRLLQLLHATAARDRQLIFGPSLSDAGPLCYSLLRIEGTLPGDCRQRGWSK